MDYNDSYHRRDRDRNNAAPRPRQLRNDHNPNSKSSRTYPIGVAVLKTLLEGKSSLIALELLKKNSGYEILLNEEEIKDYKLELLIKILARAVESKTNSEGNLDLLLFTFKNSNFNKNLMSYISNVKYDSTKATEYLPHIASLIENFVRLTPNEAFSKVSELTDICYGAIQFLKSESYEVTSLERMFRNLQLHLKESKVKWQRPHGRGKISELEKLSNEIPPEDFRDLEVIPTVADLVTTEIPFVRPNIVDKKYQSSEHYLDVQFRLLREDFIRPLREGLQNYRNGVYKNKSDIRIYSEVVFVESKIEGKDLVYYIKLQLSKYFKADRSKRFMFGNILCLSKDNFDTMIIGTVCNRESLDNRLLGIKIETENSSFDMEGVYSVVESKAYFVSYMHTLKALQQFNMVPLEDYIVFVNETAAPPSYLERFTIYDFGVIIESVKTARLAQSRIKFMFGHRISIDADKGESEENLGRRDVCLLDGLAHWPSDKELKLDDSQRKALHSALTRKVAIIQGPPGTGKTFLGLLITKLLLHNKSNWNANGKGPILVVCYTNHALDQFLEGISLFTNSIVRVGSRSTNENLKKYQINRFINQRCYAESRAISTSYYEVRNEINQIKNEIEHLSLVLKKLDIVGIISIHSLKHSNRSLLLPKFTMLFENVSLRNFLNGVSINSRLQKQSETNCGMPLQETDRKINIGIQDQMFQDAECAPKMNDNVQGQMVEDSECSPTLNDSILVQAVTELYSAQKTNGNTKEQTVNDIECDQTIKANTDIKDSLLMSEDQLKHFIQDQMMKEQEYVRKLDEDEDDDDYFIASSSLTTVRSELLDIRYEITEEELAKQIGMLKDKIDMDPYNKNYRHLYDYLRILDGEKRNIEMGCKFPHDENECLNLEKAENFNDLSIIKRWKLYNFWKMKLRRLIQKEKSKLEQRYMKAGRNLAALKDIEYLSVMNEADVVGMTTTGAAQYCRLLHDLAPPIVIVEEAAEILEAHVISAISKKCQHLILIGDHQQLRPNPNVYDLAINYNMDISLFERMIKNGITYEKLVYQHRMKPCISSLLVPTIYEDLQDHPSVLKHPKIKGVLKDLFFIDHEQYERQDIDGNDSVENQHEAEFMIGLCRHLRFQGYNTEDITILTPYSGQYRLLKELQQYQEHCKGVRISILDNYQGEECNIILLSLVRSNEEERVGFVKLDNRVCVALSRAKHGLYAIGNMNQLAKSSQLWNKIRTKLIDGGNIGLSLKLVCESHPDEEILVSSSTDILLKSPEGGCRRPCMAPLPECRHLCPRTCHIYDKDHSMVQCTLPCPKTLCKLGHSCPGMCSEACRPCQEQVSKLLPCNHTHTIDCCIEPKEYKCPTKVDREIPYCKHTISMLCSDNPRSFVCTRVCDTRLDCGHQCKKNCHVRSDPEHEQYDCYETCNRTPKNCRLDHKCNKKCYEDCGFCKVLAARKLPCKHTINNVACGMLDEDIPCSTRCPKTLPCSHPCPKLCGEICGECKVSVIKVAPVCLHKIQVPCSKPAEEKYCFGKCVKKLPCGHPCSNKCNEPCSQKCEYPIPSLHKCPRNHDIKLPCYKVRSSLAATLFSSSLKADHWDDCSEICGMALECGHQCKGRCGQCYNGRLHVKCDEDCKRVLVCGHICKAPCSTECPPCQDQCEWKCHHSACKKKCGIPCVNCKEKCRRVCRHATCKKMCGEPCNINPCDQPCTLKLKCGHICIGFCGEPCPSLCRICDEDDVTQIFFGDEDEDDARFVKLEDCGHVFESNGLKRWLEEGSNEIGMKKCPVCNKTIYNTKRFQAFILKVFADVMKVKRKFFSKRAVIKKEAVKMDLKEMQRDWPREIMSLQRKLGFDDNFTLKRKQREISDMESNLISFQIDFLKKATTLRRDISFNISVFQDELNALVKLLMKQDVNISHQMMDEISCELRRLALCPSIEKLRNYASSSTVAPILANINGMMSSSIKFDTALEIKVLKLLKDAEQHVGKLSISKAERVMIVTAMGFKQGHWFKCPNGHIYCIADCGGATVESVCPECKSKIGGSNHRLRDDNRLATEMDNAVAPAWPGSVAF